MYGEYIQVKIEEEQIPKDYKSHGIESKTNDLMFRNDEVR